MFVIRDSDGRVAAAYLERQFSQQEWLPIDSRSLQVFLAAAPRSDSSRGGRRGGRVPPLRPTVEIRP